MPITRFQTISCGKAILGATVMMMAGPVLADSEKSADAAGKPDVEENAPEVKSVIGALAFYRPEYLGGADHEVMVLPFLDFQYNQYCLNPINGAGIGMRPIKALTIGLGVGYAFGRDEDDADRLEGLGDIDPGARLNFFADYTFKIENLGPVLNAAYALGFSVDHQFTGARTGVSGDFSLGRNDRLGQRMLLINGVSADFGSASFQEAWFGISERQSLRSRLPVYESDDIFHAVGASSRLVYFVTQDLSLITAILYKKLLGDAADSPLVENQDQLRYQLGFSYSL